MLIQATPVEEDAEGKLRLRVLCGWRVLSSENVSPLQVRVIDLFKRNSPIFDALTKRKSLLQLLLSDPDPEGVRTVGENFYCRMAPKNHRSHGGYYLPDEFVEEYKIEGGDILISAIGAYRSPSKDSPLELIPWKKRIETAGAVDKWKLAIWLARRAERLLDKNFWERVNEARKETENMVDSVINEWDSVERKESELVVRHKAGTFYAPITFSEGEIEISCPAGHKRERVCIQLSEEAPPSDLSLEVPELSNLIRNQIELAISLACNPMDALMDLGTRWVCPRCVARGNYDEEVTELIRNRLERGRHLSSREGLILVALRAREAGGEIAETVGETIDEWESKCDEVWGN